MERGEWFNSISHLIGTVLALIGATTLVIISIEQDDPWKIVSFAVYGTMLILLYAMSTLYHSLRGRAKAIFKQLDHVAVYLLIAGTYTPFTLIVLRGPWGWTLFGVVWGLALLGMTQDLLVRVKIRAVSVVLYVLMGWLIVIAMGPLARRFPTPGLVWLVVGGAFYTVGIVFYAMSKSWKPGHAVWHVFVLLGSIAHFISMLGWIALKP